MQEKSIVLYQGTGEGFCAVSKTERSPETQEACTFCVIDGRKDTRIVLYLFSFQGNVTLFISLNEV